MKNQFVFELDRRTSHPVPLIIENFPQMLGMANGLLKHRHPNNDDVLPDTSIVITDSLMNLDSFIKTIAGDLNKSVLNITSFLAGRCLPASFEINECYSYRSRVIFELAKKLSGYLLSTHPYDGLIHFTFGHQVKEYFEASGRVSIYYGWDAPRGKLYRIVIQFEDSQKVDFDPILKICAGYNLKQLEYA